MNPDKIINIKELQRLVPLSRSTLWRMEKAGDFPRRIQIGARRVGWRLSEIAGWIDHRHSKSSNDDGGTS